MHAVLASAVRRVKASVAYVRSWVGSLPATVVVPAVAALVGAVAAVVAVWLIRLHRRETRPVLDVPSG